MALPRKQIARRLDRIEDDHGVSVLYACESGSRAWGFASADSDYDVRFVYVHPRDWYLTIDPTRPADTIDPPITDDLDLHGWDLRKALRLFRDANPTLREWLRSPIVYRERAAVLTPWRAMRPDYYSPGAVGRAYRGLAQSIAEQSLADPPVAHKAYLYVLRALLAVRWVEQGRGPVPIEMGPLVEQTVETTALRDAIDALLTEKRAGTEAAAGPRRPVIHDAIDDEIERQQGLSLPRPDPHPGPEPLNALFRDALAQASFP